MIDLTGHFWKNTKCSSYIWHQGDEREHEGRAPEFMGLQAASVIEFKGALCNNYMY